MVNAGLVGPCHDKTLTKGAKLLFRSHHSALKTERGAVSHFEKELEGDFALEGCRVLGVALLHDELVV
jgi:hypothetical protein